jgi:hypothetical protein
MVKNSAADHLQVYRFLWLRILLLVFIIWDNNSFNFIVSNAVGGLSNIRTTSKTHVVELLAHYSERKIFLPSSCSVPH